MRLLIVEDEKQLCENIAAFMRAEGYSSDCCFDGIDAVDYIGSTDYDAVVLDIMMNSSSGSCSLLEAIISSRVFSGSSSAGLLSETDEFSGEFFFLDAALTADMICLFMVSKTTSGLAFPMWKKLYTVGPQTYILTSPGVCVTKSSFFLSIVL